MGKCKHCVLHSCDSAEARGSNLAFAGHKRGRSQSHREFCTTSHPWRIPSLESVAQPLMTHHSIHMPSSAEQPASNLYQCADFLTASRWTMTPCESQPPASNFQFTHTRKLRLPLAIDVVFSHQTHRCLYAGHGQSKVVYKFADETSCLYGRAVLKLTAQHDQEPSVCQQIAELCKADQTSIKICPSIIAVNSCQELNRQKQPVREWFAWLAEYALPLDKWMLEALKCRAYESRKTCLRIALYLQTIVASKGFLLDDNNLYNFGVAENTVVIIDAGRRGVQPGHIQKSVMNNCAIKGWWHKLRWQCMPSELEECQNIWRGSDDLNDVARKLKNAGLLLPQGEHSSYGGRQHAVQPTYASTGYSLGVPAQYAPLQYNPPPSSAEQPAWPHPCAGCGSACALVAYTLPAPAEDRKPCAQGYTLAAPVRHSTASAAGYSLGEPCSEITSPRGLLENAYGVPARAEDIKPCAPGCILPAPAAHTTEYAAGYTLGEPCPEITQTPSLWDLVEHDPTARAVQWLLDQCLWGEIGRLKLLHSGQTIPLESDEIQPPNIRIETLIHVTQDRRQRYISHSDEVLGDNTTKKLLDEWKADYRAWMNQDTQQRWWAAGTQQQRHQLERKSFRSFLFHMCGCRELVLFWLRVKPCWPSLCIFHDLLKSDFRATNQERINAAVEAFTQSQQC